jgi:hypothetical protein
LIDCVNNLLIYRCSNQAILHSTHLHFQKGSDTDLPSATKSTAPKKTNGGDKQQEKKAIDAKGKGLTPRSNTVNSQHPDASSSWARNRHRSIEK